MFLFQNFFDYLPNIYAGKTNVILGPEIYLLSRKSDELQGLQRTESDIWQKVQKFKYVTVCKPKG